MMAFLTAIVAHLRRSWPLGKESERVQWRHQMEDELRASHERKERIELHRLSIQGRIAGEYRPDGGD